MELASQIKRHRSELGLSQEELAAKIYVTRQTVSNWETDRTYPDVESLLLLSVLFDVTVDELIKGDMEAMKEAIANDWKKMAYLAWGGFAFVIIGCALFIGGFNVWGWGIVPSAIIALLVWGIGMGMLAVVEHLKKQNDVVTYRELVAYSKGEPIDRDNPKSRRARQHRVLKGVLLTLAAAAVGFVVGYLMYKTGMVG
ncbi:helix-turn-helix transcriptional regulator [Arabiibacter massiliensis]|uniref:helix-turn-helix transcriptional regulator n=1 Tax=Arabiibacter massiliensis TaxID=1870985 RepID=UPI0009BB8108|nr:helix-turn-helix transcriptional regulator [Arabiibacter massiliensis]